MPLERFLLMKNEAITAGEKARRRDMSYLKNKEFPLWKLWVGICQG